MGRSSDKHIIKESNESLSNGFYRNNGNSLLREVLGYIGTLSLITAVSYFAAIGGCSENVSGYEESFSKKSVDAESPVYRKLIYEKK